MLFCLVKNKPHVDRKYCALILELGMDVNKCTLAINTVEHVNCCYNYLINEQVTEAKYSSIGSRRDV
jgi:hypothetical protein